MRTDSRQRQSSLQDNKTGNYARDTAVAINPADERYTYLKGRQVWLPIVNKAIPVVEDHVDMEFGTGVVKIIRLMTRTTLR